MIDNIELDVKSDPLKDTLTWLMYSLNFDQEIKCNDSIKNILELNVYFYNYYYIDSIQTKVFSTYFYDQDTLNECAVSFPYFSGFTVSKVGFIMPDIHAFKFNAFKTRESTINYVKEKNEKFRSYLQINYKNPKLSVWLRNWLKINENK